MKDVKLEYDVQKRAKAGTAATARVAVALYVIWLGYKLIRGVYDDSTTVPVIVGWIAGITFFVSAIFICFYSLKRWRADVEAARLPDTVSDTKEIDQPGE